MKLPKSNVENLGGQLNQVGGHRPLSAQLEESVFFKGYKIKERKLSTSTLSDYVSTLKNLLIIISVYGQDRYKKLIFPYSSQLRNDSYSFPSYYYALKENSQHI